MRKSFRGIVESIVFAGLKPGAPAPPSRRMWLPVPLGAFCTRLLSGRPPEDPLYVSNRSWRRRLLLWSLVAAPCLAVAGVVWYAMAGNMRKQDRRPSAMAPAALAERDQLLPALKRPVDFEARSQVEVVELRVEQPGRLVVGSVRNLSDRPVPRCELIFDLADRLGSRLGAVSALVTDIPAKGTASFQTSIDQKTAVFALVREVRTQ